jgi:DUF4097 and DUF4098 domain-containing protein YvlB
MDHRNTYLFKVTLALALSLIFTLLLMAPAVAAQSNETSMQNEEPYRTKTFDIDTPGKLNVQTSGGHITVEASANNSVRVEMFVKKEGHNLLPDDTSLKKWDININKNGNTVEAIAERKGAKGWNLFGGNHNISISFVVYTPRNMSTELETSGGHITSRGITGNQTIKTSGGHIELAQVEGTINAKTSGGHITISDAKGDLKAGTSGGHINVNNSEGSLQVKTSGGHIELANVNGSVKASTSGGSIQANLNSISKSVELRTSGGNIDVRIPENTALDLNLRGNYVDADIQNFSGQIDFNEVKGILNGGGPKLTAKTSGGTVKLYFN